MITLVAIAVMLIGIALLSWPLTLFGLGLLVGARLGGWWRYRQLAAELRDLQLERILDEYERRMQRVPRPWRWWPW